MSRLKHTRAHLNLLVNFIAATGLIAVTLQSPSAHADEAQAPGPTTSFNTQQMTEINQPVYDALTRNNVQTAISHAERLAALGQADALSHMILGVDAVNRLDFHTAQTYFINAFLTGDPDYSTPAAILAAWSHIGVSHSGEALHALENMPRPEGYNDAIYYNARYFLNAHGWPTGGDSFKAALKEHMGRFLLGEMAYRQQDAGTGQSLAYLALHLNPDIDELHIHAARLALRDGPQRAREVYITLSTLYAPGDAAYQSSRLVMAEALEITHGFQALELFIWEKWAESGDTAFVHYLANRHREQGDLASAIRTFDIAIADHAKAGMPNFDPGPLFLSRAQTLLDHDNGQTADTYRKIRADLDRLILEDTPERIMIIGQVHALYAKAIVAYESHDNGALDEALRHTRRAMDYMGDTEITRLRATLANRLGHYDETIRILESSLFYLGPIPDQAQSRVSNEDMVQTRLIMSGQLFPLIDAYRATGRHQQADSVISGLYNLFQQAKTLGLNLNDEQRAFIATPPANIPAPLR